MTNDSKHLQAVKSDRGFSRLPEIPGAYGGMVRVYESSAASAPHLWLQVDIPAGVTHAEREKATIHLAVEDALKLAEQLQHLVANHYQGVDPE
jgi:hypothetical protein